MLIKVQGGVLMFKWQMRIYMIASFVFVMVFLIAGCGSERTSENTTLVENTDSAIEEEASTDLEGLAPLKIKVRVIEFPPFYYQDENGQWTGLEVELAEALLKEAGFTPEFVSLPWSRALKAMEVGEVQLMMNLAKTPEREEYMNFIGAERTSRMALVVNEQYKDEPIDHVDDLCRVVEKNGIPIGLQKDVKYPPELAEMLVKEVCPKNFDYTYATKMYPKNVMNNRLFGFIEDEVAMKYQLLNNLDYEGLALHPFTFSEEDVFIGVSKHLDADKYDKLISAFKTLKSDGSLGFIIDKY